VREGPKDPIPAPADHDLAVMIGAKFDGNLMITATLGRRRPGRPGPELVLLWEDFRRSGAPRAVGAGLNDRPPVCPQWSHRRWGGGGAAGGGGAGSVAARLIL